MARFGHKLISTASKLVIVLIKAINLWLEGVLW